MNIHGVMNSITAKLEAIQMSSDGTMVWSLDGILHSNEKRVNCEHTTAQMPHRHNIE